MTARSFDCRCSHNFTCGHCLRNTKPWFYTLSDGSALPPRADFAQQGSLRHAVSMVERGE